MRRRIDPPPQPRRQPFAARMRFPRQTALRSRSFGHVAQPLFGEERLPVGRRCIRLRQAADHRVAFQPEGGRTDAVQFRQVRGGVDFRRRVEPPVGIEMGQYQQPVVAVAHFGHRQIAVSEKVVEHPAFDRQTCAGAAELGDQRIAAHQIDPIDCGNAPAGQRQQAHDISIE